MRLSVRFDGDVAIVALDGKFLAGSDGPFLRQKVKELVDAGVKKLVFDFSGVPYIDSTGLGFLAGSRATAEKSGVRMILGGVNPHVRKTLDDLKLSQFFSFAQDEPSALRDLREPGSPGPDAASGKESKSKRRSSASAD